MYFVIGIFAAILAGFSFVFFEKPNIQIACALAEALVAIGFFIRDAAERMTPQK